MFQWIQVLSRKSNGWNPKMVMPHTCNQLIFIASQICMIHTHTFLYKNDETKTVYNPETLFGGKGCVWAQIHVSSKQTSTSQKMHLTISCAHGIPRQVNIDRVCELMSSTWCVCTRDADVKKTDNIQYSTKHASHNWFCNSTMWSSVDACNVTPWMDPTWNISLLPCCPEIRSCPNDINEKKKQHLSSHRTSKCILLHDLETWHMQVSPTLDVFELEIFSASATRNMSDPGWLEADSRHASWLQLVLQWPQMDQGGHLFTTRWKPVVFEVQWQHLSQA